MKKLILILILITSFNLFADKEIELTPIVLPYDSLNIDEVYGYGATIIARSGNSIYHSTDDGASWDIALESETKLNQLYSKDPHTVFAIGDSGLVYRTMDYGASWVDVSIDTDLELRAMAAGDYSEYMIITPRRFQFRARDLGNEVITLTTQNDVELMSIVKNGKKYFFGGRYILDEYYDYFDDEWYEFKLLYFGYDEERISSHLADSKDGAAHRRNDYNTDSLLIFSLDNKLYHSVVNRGVGAVMINSNWGEVFESRVPGVLFPNQRAVHVSQNDSTINIITREGTLVQNSTNKFENQYGYKELPHYNLGVSPINNVHTIGSDDYYVASNNSKIYRTKLVEIPTSVEMVFSNSILFYNNVIELKNNTELIFITDYLGKQKELIQVGTNKYILERGLNFVTFSDKDNNIKTVKVMVIE